MKRKVRFVQYGCGKMSRYLMRYAIGKGAELQAAFDTNPDITGKDVSEIIGNGFPATGISVSPAEKVGALIKELKPDVCIITTRSMATGCFGASMQVSLVNDGPVTIPMRL